MQPTYASCIFQAWSAEKMRHQAVMSGVNPQGCQVSVSTSEFPPNCTRFSLGPLVTTERPDRHLQRSYAGVLIVRLHPDSQSEAIQTCKTRQSDLARPVSFDHEFERHLHVTNPHREVLPHSEGKSSARASSNASMSRKELEVQSRGHRGAEYGSII